jgi:CRP/FNR family cyclic AMP-dependent transcriptional regulator
MVSNGSDEELLARSPFLREGDAQVWTSIADLGEHRTISRGEIIYQQGEHARRMFYLVRGRVKLTMGNAMGMERLVTIVEARSSFGEAAAFAGLPYHISATAMEKSDLLSFDAETLLGAMLQHPNLLREVLTQIAYKQRIVAIQAESIVFHSPTERVALLLLHLSASYGVVLPGEQGTKVEVRVPLADLAGILGMSRITLSREIAKLQRAGIVTKDKRDIVVLDARALQGRAPIEVSFHEYSGPDSR